MKSEDRESLRIAREYLSISREYLREVIRDYDLLPKNQIIHILKSSKVFLDNAVVNIDKMNK